MKTVNFGFQNMAPKSSVSFVVLREDFGSQRFVLLRTWNKLEIIKNYMLIVIVVVVGYWLVELRLLRNNSE